VQKHARRLGISRILHITFLLANELLEVPVPDFFGEDHTARRLGRQFAKTIRARNAYNPESVSYFRAALQSRERTADRARLLGRLMFTPGPGEWDALQLPDAMFPAYPMVRLARLARRFLF
jgi:hypothetical protein